MSLFHCAKCLPDLVERVYRGDGNLQVAVGDELCQFCEHTGIGGVGAAGGFDWEHHESREVNNGIHAPRRHAKIGHGEFHIATTKKVQEGVDATLGRGGPEALGEVVAVVDRDDAMGRQPVVAFMLRALPLENLQLLRYSY